MSTLVLGEEISGDEVTSGLGGGVLCEMDEVNGGTVLSNQISDLFLKRGLRVGEVEGDWSLIRLDEYGFCAGEFRDSRDEALGFTDGGGHEAELRLGQCQEWDLP